jgi:tight adherence protein B
MAISPHLLIAIFVAVALGGLTFVFMSGDSRAKKRQDALKRGSEKSLVGIDRNARRKQVADSLKELEEKNTRKKMSLQSKITQAGLSLTSQQFIIFSAVAGLGLGVLVFLFSHNPLMAGGVAVIGVFGLPNFALSFLRKRRIKKFINEFPNAIDVIVRGVRAGLPLGDCVRIVAGESAEPVRTEFRILVESQALGLTLAEAVERSVERMPITEMNFFAIVIAIQAKAGGNLSEALGNLSRVLRERKKMKGKIGAMSMEAKASAAIIGCIPFAVTGMLYASSPNYISLLWTTSHGRIISGIGLFWMAIGTAAMKKMVSFDF